MKIEAGVLLSRFTTFGSGGPARAFARPETVVELEQALAWAGERELPPIPIGFGSNVLVADAGVEALVLRLQGELAAVRIEGERMSAGGGSPNAVCALKAREVGLGGLEFVSSIPGTIGGGVRMNAGAWGWSFADLIERVLVVDASGSRWLDVEQLGLRYRGSNLGPGEIVAAAEFTLVPRGSDEIKGTTRELKEKRKSAQPINTRTFGSVFKNPEHELSAGRMLDACELRGLQIGAARISPVHANFIENGGGATTADALALMDEARRRAYERFRVVLEPEVRLVGSISLRPVETDA